MGGSYLVSPIRIKILSPIIMKTNKIQQNLISNAKYRQPPNLLINSCRRAGPLFRHRHYRGTVGRRPLPPGWGWGPSHNMRAAPLRDHSPRRTPNSSRSGGRGCCRGCWRWRRTVRRWAALCNEHRRKQPKVPNLAHTAVWTTIWRRHTLKAALLQATPLFSLSEWGLENGPQNMSHKKCSWAVFQEVHASWHKKLKAFINKKIPKLNKTWMKKTKNHKKWHCSFLNGQYIFEQVIWKLKIRDKNQNESSEEEEEEILLEEFWAALWKFLWRRWNFLKWFWTLRKSERNFERGGLLNGCNFGKTVDETISRILPVILRIHPEFFF